MLQLGGHHWHQFVAHLTRCLNGAGDIANSVGWVIYIPLGLCLLVLSYKLWILLSYKVWTYFIAYKMNPSSTRHVVCRDRGEPGYQSYSYLNHDTHGVRMRLVMALLILFTGFFIAGFCVEYVRQYQVEVAKIHTLMVVGPPPECSPDTMNLWQTLKSWLVFHLSWKHSPCEEYHEALLVWPIFQVNPLLVFTVLCSKVVASPLSVFSPALAEACSSFFKEIPVQWQPFFIIFFAVITLVLLTMTCRYKLAIPFLMKMEPNSERTSSWDDRGDFQRQYSQDKHVIQQKVQLPKRRLRITRKEST